MTCDIHHETEECARCLLDKLFAVCKVIYYPPSPDNEPIEHNGALARIGVKDEILAAVRKEME